VGSAARPPRGQGWTQLGQWQVITTGGLQDCQFFMQHLGASLATVAQESAVLADKLGSSIMVDLTTLEETASRTPVDLHVHVRAESAAIDTTMILPLCVGLAAVALGRKIKPRVALVGNSPFCFAGVPVAPVVGALLSDSAVQACVEKGIGTVVGGKHAHGDGQGISAEEKTGAVAYEGVDDLFQAMEHAST
jgi:hypothetical protein